MKLSVCIPTYNPTLTLNGTIESLLAQKELIQQLVIVIDNDQYEKQAELLKEKYGKIFDLSVASQRTTSRAATRNRCAQLSKGEILLFLDDDMLVEKDLLKRHLDYHSANPDTIVTGNGYRNPKDAKDDFSKYIVSIERSMYSNHGETMKVNYDNFVFTACNMSIPKTLFERLNCFDERLKDSEDYDFGMRALKEGINIIYDRNLIAWHKDWPDIRKFVNRQNQYAIGRKKLIDTHPDYAKIHPAFVSKQNSGLKKKLLASWKNSSMSFDIFNKATFKLLPLRLKFFFYRLTIAAHALRPEDIIPERDGGTR